MQYVFLSLSHTLNKTVLKSSQATFLLSWHLCSIVATTSKFDQSQSLTNTIQFSQNGLYLQSGLILIWSNNNMLINLDHNWLSWQVFLSASPYTFLTSWFLYRDADTVRKGFLFLSTVRRVATHLTAVARTFIYMERLWSEMTAEEWWLSPPRFHVSLFLP